VCLHGFTDTWRSWELVLPALEREPRAQREGRRRGRHDPLKKR
jgi:hypothetical protein